MGLPHVLFAYIGPDVALPVMSVLAGAFGFLMMVGRAPFRFAAKVWRRVTGKAEPESKGNEAPSEAPSTPEST